MASQWRSVGTLIVLLLISIGVFAAAFLVRTTFLPDILPIAAAEETQSLRAWSMRSGQYEDMEGAALRVLSDDDVHS
jgi:hypothetical protein